MTLNEHLQYIKELVRKASSYLETDSGRDLEDMLNKQFRDRYIERNPKCFLPLYRMNNADPVPFFPVCNRWGVVEPKLIAFSKRLAKRMSQKEFVDQEKLKTIEVKLASLDKKFSKDIPKPQKAAILKSKSTRKLNKILK